VRGLRATFLKRFEFYECGVDNANEGVGLLLLLL